ncbi:MAG: hypothetical protein JNL12_00835 [Planctomycetes bacterium]|nr:hypothetical protein [Planctomycetota bacterium]
MPQVQVKKVVAVCFLEAVKLALDQLGAHRLELSQQGVKGSPDLVRIYGDVRRLRDYLQRCIGACKDVVDLDMASPDASLLVGCCRRSVEAIELRLSEQAVPPDERQWLQKKRQVIADWAVELAEKPLTELPLPKLSPVQSETSRALTTRLQNKVFGDVRDRPKIVAPNSQGPSMTAGLQSFAEQIVAMDPDATEDDGSAPVAPFVAPHGAPAGGQSSFVRGVPTHPNGQPVLDHHKLHDPRLRALAAVDSRAYERAVESNDHRLATVLLASLLEAALVDYAVPRRGELAVTGSPETWNLQDLLLKALGDRAAAPDRALAFHLFASRNLLRPALQLVTPAVVTQASFERMREFVQRALHELGFGSSTGVASPAASLDP